MVVGWILGRAPVALAVAALGCGRTPLLGPEIGGGGDSDGGDDFGGSSDDGSEGEPPTTPCPDLDSHTRDCDRDGIPDADDPFPEDAERPGRARSDVIYLSSTSALYQFAPDDPDSPHYIGELELLDGVGGEVTDLAIDRFGVLYAVTRSEIYACDPLLARCWALGELATNSLGFLPLGVLEHDDDTLVTLTGRTWMRIGLRGPELTPVTLGSVASAYSSRGDVVYDRHGTTWFSSPGESSDFLVSILPESGASDLQVAGAFPSTVDFNGLAGFNGYIWIFDEAGVIQRWHPRENTLEIRDSGVAQGFSGAAANVESR